MLIFRELELTRSVTARDPLSRFFRSQTRWELLLLIAANAGKEELGIWNYIDRLTTRTESPMTIYAFIRDRIEDGSLVLQPGSKKSRKLLTLSTPLESSLRRFLSHRYIYSAQNPSMFPRDERSFEPEVETVPIGIASPDLSAGRLQTATDSFQA